MTVPWKSWGVLLICIVVAAFFLNRERRLRSDAERDAESAKLILKQQIVENASTRRELQGTVSEMLSRNTELRAAYDQAMVAAKDAKPASTARLDTGPLTVHDVPEPRGTGQEGGGNQPGPIPPGQAVSPPSLCVLTPDQHISVEVEQVELQTRAGNSLVVGTASVYREEPVRALLAEGRFRSTLSDARSLEVPSAPRWGVLLTAAWMPQGRTQGVGVLFPPIPLLGVRLEPSAALLGGAAFLGQATLGVRF